MSVIELFWPALCLGIVLVFIHSVFGLEIIKRGVIFTDLAIGQIAALGMAISITYLDGAWQTPLVLLFAITGAIIISLASRYVAQVEAFIGLLYAFGISSLMLILAQSSEGTELFKQISAADILFTSAQDLWKSTFIYIGIGLGMFVIYPRMKGVMQELFFFILLAILVSSSVQTAGVLVVFSLLVAPAYLALIQKRFKPFFFACIFGSLSVVAAMVISYNFDLPTGYTIVFVTALLTLLGVVLLSARRL